MLPERNCASTIGSLIGVSTSTFGKDMRGADMIQRAGSQTTAAAGRAYLDVGGKYAILIKELEVDGLATETLGNIDNAADSDEGIGLTKS
jgi:hypothetical protein